MLSLPRLFSFDAKTNEREMAIIIACHFKSVKLSQIEERHTRTRKNTNILL